MPALNRIVSFAGPIIASVAGAAATWILVKLNALGIAGLDHAATTQQIASGLTFGLTSLLVWLGQQKWLTGHQLWEHNEAMVQAAALAAPTPGPAVAAGIDPEIEALIALGEDLPDDEEEFAAPPDDELAPGTAELTGAVDDPDAP